MLKRSGLARELLVRSSHRGHFYGKGRFQVTPREQRQLERRKRRLAKRLDLASNCRAHQPDPLGSDVGLALRARRPTRVRRLTPPGAYMVIASLAWTLKAWMGLVQPRIGDRDDLLRMEFKRFANYLMRIPCQIVRTARRVLVRILGYTDRVRLLFETVAAAGRVSVRRWSDASRRAGRLGRSGVT
jgi:hypothetical protein